LNAYQKAIVMKYIDNLIDWGDNLFAQDTRESITEAEMLYQLASDILGSRPAKMGVCETAADRDLTYERIAPEIGTGSEFLITLENVYVRARQYYGPRSRPSRPPSTWVRCSRRRSPRELRKWPKRRTSPG